MEEGDVLTLTCKVGGNPFPENIRWEKVKKIFVARTRILSFGVPFIEFHMYAQDGVELKKDDRTSMRTALDGTVTLRVREIKKEDFGKYKITVANEHGTDSSEAQASLTKHMSV